MCILKCFEEVSGLNVNMSKSRLYGIGSNMGEVIGLARGLKCSAGETHFIYLGLPIGERMWRVDAWKSVIEKFRKKLGDWKTKAMSFGGRMTLIKSMLGSLPLYYFSLFRVPMEVLKTLEGIIWNFF